MHKIITPEKDTYIENSTKYILKNFGLDELLSVCVNDIVETEYKTSVLQQSVNRNFDNFYVTHFYGIYKGSVIGSGSLSGNVIYCGNIEEDNQECP